MDAERKVLDQAMMDRIHALVEKERQGWMDYCKDIPGAEFDYEAALAYYIDIAQAI